MRNNPDRKRTCPKCGSVLEIERKDNLELRSCINCWYNQEVVIYD